MKKNILITVFFMIALLPQVAFAPNRSWAGDDGRKTIQALFVQDAEDVSFDGGRMTLKGVSLFTVFFLYSPDQFGGILATEEFVPLWSQGKGSVLADPVNATLSIFGDGKLTELALVLRSPRLLGDELTYDIDMSQGGAPVQGGICSLLIDVN